MGEGKLDVSNFGTQPAVMTVHNGFVWPAEDIKCTAAIWDEAGDSDVAMGLCKQNRSAIQAGGNCGVWANHIAQRFRTVYSFEPDAVNFWCLAQNAAHNVVKFQAALGRDRGTVGLNLVEGNIGAHTVKQGGRIPVLRIDDLGLTDCDFIQLDIEGFEFYALRGAEATIDRCRPVIQIEEKGLCEAYGVKKGAAERWLIDRFRYRVRHKVRRDVILAP